MIWIMPSSLRSVVRMPSSMALSAFLASAARHICQKVQRILIDLSMKAAHTFPGVFHSSSQKDFYIFFFQRFQLKNAGIWKSGRLFTSKYGFSVVAPIRITVPSSIKREKVILLSFIKPVDLVDKKDRLPAVHPLQVFRLFHNLFHILFSRYCCIDLLKRPHWSYWRSLFARVVFSCPPAARKK